MGEGRDNNTQKAQQLNIKAAIAVANTVRSTLGPLGMDKMCVDPRGHFVVSNDGATILRELDVAHPGAQMVVNMSKTQESECKDGTTSVVVLAGKLLENAERLLAKGIHPNAICKGYRTGTKQALDILPDLVLKDVNLKAVAGTAITGKAAEHNMERVTSLCVDAVRLTEGDESRIKVISQVGGSFDDSHLFDGVILNKEFGSTANPTELSGKVLLLNTGLTPPPMNDSMRVQLGSMEAVQQFQMAETHMLIERARAIIELGVVAVFVRDSVHEAIIHTLAQEGIGVVTRVPTTDLQAIAHLTNSPVYHMTEDAVSDSLGDAKIIEKEIGDIRFVTIEVKDPDVVTLVLQGATRQTVDELERAFDDAIGVTALAYRDQTVVAGGGSVYSFISNQINTSSVLIPSGRNRLAIKAFAESLLSVPITIGENAGHNALDVLIKIEGETDKHNAPCIETGDMINMADAGVVEPYRVVKQSIQSAAEVAIAVLRIDDIIGSKGDEEQNGQVA